jgi:hypothetical protein
LVVQVEPQHPGLVQYALPVPQAKQGAHAGWVVVYPVGQVPPEDETWLRVQVWLVLSVLQA